jgi:hypothetical protein
VIDHPDLGERAGGRRRRSLKEIAAAIKAQERFCERQWNRFLRRCASIPNSPFHVTVSLDRDQNDWVDVEVNFSGRWAGGTTAEFSVPFQALFKAAELARGLYEALEKRGR